MHEILSAPARFRRAIVDGAHAVRDGLRGYTDNDYKASMHTLLTGALTADQLKGARAEEIKNLWRMAEIPSTGPGFLEPSSTGAMPWGISNAIAKQETITRLPDTTFESTARQRALQIVFDHDRHEIKRLERIAMNKESVKASRILSGEITDDDKAKYLSAQLEQAYNAMLAPAEVEDEVNRELDLPANAVEKARPRYDKEAERIQNTPKGAIDKMLMKESLQALEQAGLICDLTKQEL